jgi:exonuclease SbcC
MRPLRIELQGFTAYRDKQEIDLEELDLFVITGQTGAGKTSLLDAMIFALYGRVPRASSHGMRELVTLGQAEARVELEFSLDGQRYRVARRLPRQGAQSATLEILDGEDWRADPDLDGSGIKVVNERLIDLLRLPYDAFVKAVVLPQGDWHKFLKGEPKERRQILTDLLGLKHYLAMGERARARATELQTRIQRTQELLETTFADVGDEQLASLRTEAEVGIDRVRRLSEIGAAAEDHESERRKFADTARDAGGVKGDLEELSADLASAKDRVTEAEKREVPAAEALKGAADALASAKGLSAKAGLRLKDRQANYGRLEDLAKVDGALGEVATCTEERAEQEELLAELTTEAADLAPRLEKANKAFGDATEKLKTARSAVAEFDTAKRAAETESQKLQQLLARVDEDLDSVGQAGQLLTEASERRATASEAIAPLKERMEAAQEHLTVLEHEHAAVVLAADLGPGDECPICHRPLEEHPQLEKVAAKAIGSATRKRSAAQEAVQKADAELTAATEAEQRAREQKAVLEKALKKRLDSYDDRATLAAASEAAAAQATEAGNQADQGLTGFTEAEEEEGKARQGISDLTTELRSCNERSGLIDKSIEGIDRRRQAAEALITGHFGDTLPRDPAKQLAAEREELVDAQQAVEDSRQTEAEAQERVDAVREAVSAVKDELAELDQQIAVLRTRSEQAREDLVSACEGVKGAGAPQALPRSIKDRQSHVDRLHEWTGAALSCHEELERELRKQIDALAKGLLDLASQAEIEVAEAQDVLRFLREAESDAQRAGGQLEAQVKTMEDQIAEKTKLTESIAEEGAQATILRALGTELRGDRFLAFIQQETLDLLAARASDELMRISGDRYGLTSKDGSFSVIDHVNADEERSVDTLSGGETFMASLSLALALSQHVGELATEGMGAKLEAVFIDEGFGALDDETLEEVIDALERLREGELMVGVITHVKALAERIPDGVRVEAANGRARIERVGA